MSKPKTTARPPLRLIDCAKQRHEANQRETLDILRALTARAVRGEVTGLVLCFCTPDGEEQCVFTGPYKASPALGVNAAFRLGLRLTQMQEALT